MQQADDQQKDQAPIQSQDQEEQKGQDLPQEDLDNLQPYNNDHLNQDKPQSKQNIQQEDDMIPYNNGPYLPSNNYNSKTGSITSKEEMIWKAYDFLFPGGRIAKLIKISDANTKNMPFNDILFKLKMLDGSPVINLIGAKDTNRGKFYGGLARAAFNTDAIIIDNAIATGLEKYAIRRGLKVIGVAPENEVRYPKVNPEYTDPYEISNGHTHLFLLNNREKNMFWGMEANFKIQLCKKIAEGRMNKQGHRDTCKILHILFGESDSFMAELQLAVMNNQPILVVKGSELCNEYFANQNRINQVYSEPSFGPLLRKGQFFGLNSLESEDVAQYVHFLLTVTPQRIDKRH